MHDLRTQLRQILQGRVCLVGVGNVDLGDDALGVKLAQMVEDLPLAICNLRIILAGSTPERCLAELSHGDFDHVLFLDAVEFGAEPGAVALLNSTEMAARFPQISTHKLSLGLLAKMVEATCPTKVCLLGVQPESLKEGHTLTPTVQASVELLADLLADATLHASRSTLHAPCRVEAQRRRTHSALSC